MGLLCLQIYNRVMALDLSQNFVSKQYLNERMELNTLILTRFRLGLFCLNLHKFIKQLCPLSHVRISNQLNTLRLNEGTLTKFCICIDINKFRVGVVMHQMVQIYNQVMVFKSC